MGVQHEHMLLYTRWTPGKLYHHWNRTYQLESVPLWKIIHKLLNYKEIQLQWPVTNTYEHESWFANQTSFHSSESDLDNIQEEFLTIPLYITTFVVNQICPTVVTAARSQKGWWKFVVLKWRIRLQWPNQYFYMKSCPIFYLKWLLSRS